MLLRETLRMAIDKAKSECMREPFQIYMSEKHINQLKEEMKSITTFPQLIDGKKGMFFLGNPIYPLQSGMSEGGVLMAAPLPPDNFNLSDLS